MTLERSASGLTPGPLTALLFTLGSLLIIIGAFLLLYIALLVYKTINNPADVPLIQFILEHIKLGDQMMTARMVNPNDPMNVVNLDLQWSESTRTVSFFFMGAVVSGILAGIVSVLISSGVAILQVAGGCCGKLKGKPLKKSQIESEAL